MRKVLLLIVAVAFCCVTVEGQSIHFSQYYNAPLLQNPANTGLLAEYDYRLGMNYRSQWVTVPVPYSTFSAFGDCKIGGNANNERHNNWLGIGFALFNDKAGEGDLSLFQIQGDLAYHLRLSEHTMISLGLSGTYAQRTVNFQKLTFDAQWDGFIFNSALPNGEKGIAKTNYYSISSGLNFAWFPNEFVYAKLGGGLLNINQPVETFYSGKNTLDYRPIGNLDVAVRILPKWLSETSVYYTTQSGASELLAGELERLLLSDSRQGRVELLLGYYLRNADAMIGAIGMQVSRWQFMASYDLTLSDLTYYNKGQGAIEFSLIYQGPYHPDNSIAKTFGCPRFF